MTQTLPRRDDRRTPSRRRRRRRAALHRAKSLPGTLGVTALGAVLPGSGFVFVGRRYLGLLVLLPTLCIAVAGGWYAAGHVDTLIRVAVDPRKLLLVTAGLLVLLVAWVAIVVSTYRMVKPRHQPRLHAFVGGGFVLMLCLLVAAPLAVGARYSYVQADLVSHIFKDTDSATRPEGVTAKNPWGDRDRVNLLLLGGDGGVDREGIRTDSVMIASMDTKSGDTVLFSLPRNLMNVPFPEGSELQQIYPEGFTGDGDPGEFMLNAIYRNVPANHPGAVGGTDNEGADALKMGVSGVLGIDVDYYMLVNLDGFEQIVDAMGGVTVNINQPIPIGGNTDAGVEPTGYLDPGPDQRLNGRKALWFARGRYGLDDYNRMERQRCMIDAIVDKAHPANLLRRYQSLASAGKEIIRTDIPQKLLPAFVDLSMEVKDHDLRSVVFRSSDEFNPGNPDFEYMHAAVQKALDPPAKKPKPKGGEGASQEPSAGPSEEPSEEPTEGATDAPSGDAESPDEAVEATDSCAYNPVE